jgi:hypothetical protein
VSKTPDPARFVAETRLSQGRSEFNAWLAEQVEKETRVALYSRDTESRSVAAGRAQVWHEFQALFARP